MTGCSADRASSASERVCDLSCWVLGKTIGRSGYKCSPQFMLDLLLGSKKPIEDRWPNVSAASMMWNLNEVQKIWNNSHRL